MRMRKKFKLKGEDYMILQTDDNTDTANVLSVLPHDIKVFKCILYVYTNSIFFE